MAVCGTVADFKKTGTQTGSCKNRRNTVGWNYVLGYGAGISVDVVSRRSMVYRLYVKQLLQRGLRRDDFTGTFLL